MKSLFYILLMISLETFAQKVEVRNNRGTNKFLYSDKGITGKEKASASDLDERIIGIWIEKQTFDLDGKLDKSVDKSSKNYKHNYLSDGRLVVDSRKFRDAFQRDGMKFDFSSIPKFLWNTKENRILYLHIPDIPQTFESTYIIKGDSLIINEGNVMRYFVRESSKNK